MVRSFDVYYFYYGFGSLINVYKIKEDEFVHFLVDFDIYFVSELPF